MLGLIEEEAGNGWWWGGTDGVHRLLKVTVLEIAGAKVKLGLRDRSRGPGASLGGLGAYPYGDGLDRLDAAPRGTAMSLKVAAPKGDGVRPQKLPAWRFCGHLLPRREGTPMTAIANLY